MSIDSCYLCRWSPLESGWSSWWTRHLDMARVWPYKYNTWPELIIDVLELSTSNFLSIYAHIIPKNIQQPIHLQSKPNSQLTLMLWCSTPKLTARWKRGSTLFHERRLNFGSSICSLANIVDVRKANMHDIHDIHLWSPAAGRLGESHRQSQLQATFTSCHRIQSLPRRSSAVGDPGQTWVLYFWIKRSLGEQKIIKNIMKSLEALSPKGTWNSCNGSLPILLKTEGYTCHDQCQWCAWSSEHPKFTTQLTVTVTILNLKISYIYICSGPPPWSTSITLHTTLVKKSLHCLDIIHQNCLWEWSSIIENKFYCEKEILL